VLYRSNTSLEKLIIDFQHQFYKNQEFENYTEVTRTSKNLSLIFNTSFTKIKNSEITETFDCVRLSNCLCVSSISFNRTQSMWVRLSSIKIKFDRVWLTTPEENIVHEKKGLGLTIKEFRPCKIVRDLLENQQECLANKGKQRYEITLFYFGKLTLILTYFRCTSSINTNGGSKSSKIKETNFFEKLN